MGPDRSEVRRDRLCRDRSQVVEEPADKAEWLIEIVRRGLLHQIGRWPGRRHHEEKHPANRPGSGAIKDPLEQHVDGPVVEKAAIGNPVRAGDIGKGRHRRPSWHAPLPGGSGCPGDERGLESDGERRRAASGQCQRWDCAIFCEVGLGEREQTAPVDVLYERAERVGEPAGFSGEQGRRDV